MELIDENSSFTLASGAFNAKGRIPCGSHTTAQEEGHGAHYKSISSKHQC
jgi:hypothetical protein